MSGRSFKLATVRVATAHDAAFLPALERSAAQAFRAIESLGWLADADVMRVERHLQLIALGTCWVAVGDNGQVQGFLSAQIFDSDLHIYELSVAQGMQGRGLGRQLLETVMSEAYLRQLRAVTLTTFCDVPWNAPFYQRLGFQQERSLAPDHRLAEALREEYRHGFAPGSRCAMSWQVVAR
ncbi:GNAT family N-acetyltransferase [Pseudomonas sp. PAMC 26793]|jgi:GNAT superfamily N-acetyltransferase|uniref:GNAT family N-acetyltransferase n=1 Tax=Pseudomonas sp. PAMC 26793 TaxID=1240676 RepID=UPI0002E13494|nr:GNAT family N-acetyltransferase [Pseudomonas sp. PAMC 26793]